MEYVWKFIKVGIALFLIFLGASCTASRNINNHMRECGTELQLSERIRAKQFQTKEQIELEMKTCVEEKLGFPENIFSLWNPVHVKFNQQ
ncbi:hypothetical protein Tbd_0370 [Thiobacillus denitrificans ATCC 25259]|uniref:Lipoprotein n=1 Tax=Thiobacillus denitrificans (strain ATCC 25259 / T1) TaxID=292415 RepID=Q3SLT2_THIDA|nr:hypothetical protein Tbd_0370 [Thiobacillus denitrificans ATCC 25259]